MTMKVWIDQNLCTGDGICSEIEPALFGGHDNGLWYVKEADWPDIYNGEDGEPKLKMGHGLAAIPEPNMETTIEAAESCPGECIFIEVMD